MCVTKDSIPAMFRVACLILCLVRASLQESIISINEFAVPAAIKAGESAELQCQYGLAAGAAWPGSVFVKWFWTPLGGGADARRQIYQLVLNSSRLLDQRDLELQRKLDQHLWHFSNIEIKDNYTILLKDLQPKHSGMYECKVENIQIDDARQYRNMIVYTAGSGPVMNVSEAADGPDEDEEDDVRVRCRADGVAPRPDLVITLNGKEVPGDDIEEEVTVLPDGLFDIVANTTLSKSAVLGARIRCELFYVDTNVTHEAFFVEHTFEEMGGATASAPEATETPAAVDPTTETPGNAGVAWSLSRGLLTPVALLVAGLADLYV